MAREPNHWIRIRRGGILKETLVTGFRKME